MTEGSSGGGRRGAWAVSNLLQECPDIGAPELELAVQYRGEEHASVLGRSFSRKAASLTQTFLDSQHFDSLCAFITGTLINGVTFAGIREIVILRDRDVGDPWADAWLTERKIS